MTVNSKAMRVLDKVFSAGFTDEKAISAMTIDDILAIPGIKMSDIALINDLQKCIRANHVLSFFVSKSE